MQDLGAEISQLRRLIERQLVYFTGVAHKSGIVVVKTIDVGPDLYLFGIDGRPHQRSRVIASSPLQVVDFPCRIAADKPLGDVVIDPRRIVDQLKQQGTDRRKVGRTLLIHPHEIQRRKQKSTVATLLHEQREKLR